MIKKNITYKDYNDVVRTEPFYFNMDEAEATELELSKSGGMSETLKRIVESDDRAAMYQFFKKFIMTSYGIKSEDGKRFIKSEKMSEEFLQTRAYVALINELAKDETGEAAANFFNGVLDFVNPAQ